MRGLLDPEPANQDLDDDMKKHVRYRILFVKRGYKAAFQEREAIIEDSLEGTAFAAWKLTEFIQSLQGGETEVPHVWRNKNYPPTDCISNTSELTSLPEEDKSISACPTKI